jgi:putative multiple sugar transport system substrate-binding protein
MRPRKAVSKVRLMRATSRGRRRLGVGLSLSLAAILVMTVAPPVGAATVGASWQAKVGSGGANGRATIQAYTTGSGSLALKLARLRTATYLPVTLSRGTCGSAGATLIRFPALRTTSSGTAARTSSLTAFQVRQLRAAMTGTGKIAIRVGSSTTGGTKCGVFTVLYAPIGIVLPSGWVRDQAAFQDALKTAPYGARILFSSDVATEKAAVETLLRQGIKVLILTPQDSAAAAAAADEARAAGVKVIANDRFILGTAAVDSLVTFDNLAVGAAMGQYLVDKASGAKGSNLYLYAGRASDSNSFEFLEGAWEKLQPRIADGTFVIRNSSVAAGFQGSPTLTHDQLAQVIAQVTTNWDFNTSRTLAAGNLAAAGASAKGTVFILAPNDFTARVIGDVFAADADVTTSYVTGQDADKASVQAIIDGTQGMTVFKDPRARVQAAVAAAVAFLRGGTPIATTTINNGTIEVPARLLASVTVTKANIQSALIDTGFYRASDFTGSWPGKR